MKKTPAKKTVKRTYSLREDHRPFKVELSRGECFELANQHIRTAKKIPALFAKWLALNPKATTSQIKRGREVMIELGDWHLARSNELIKILDAES